MNTVLNWAVLALLWTAILLRSPTILRGERQRALWAIWAALAVVTADRVRHSVAERRDATARLQPATPD